MTACRVAVVGLGLMGGAVAVHLRRAGHAVIGVDPSAVARDAAAAMGIEVVADAARVPADVAAVFTSLPSADALSQVVDALAFRLAPGSTVAELSTLSLAQKQRARDRLAEHGIVLLDCPISGTGVQALRADLSVYVSGEPAAWEATANLFRAFASRPRHVGEFGTGTRLKLVANLLVAIHNVASAEAMALIEAAGLDADAAIDLLCEGAGSSRIFEQRAPMMARRRYTPASMKLDVWRKDMDLIVDFAEAHGVRAPLFQASRALYEQAERRQPQDDTAAVFEVVRSGGRASGSQAASVAAQGVGS